MGDFFEGLLMILLYILIAIAVVVAVIIAVILWLIGSSLYAVVTAFLPSKDECVEGPW